MGQLAHVLVHTATPLRYEETGVAWVEGEAGDGPEPTPGASFAALLFLPAGSEEAGPRSRKVSRPTLLYEPMGLDPLSADDELLVSAPELEPWTGASEARWQVEGEPQPFGPPGKVIGVQVTLKQVSS